MVLGPYVKVHEDWGYASDCCVTGPDPGQPDTPIRHVDLEHFEDGIFDVTERVDTDPVRVFDFGAVGDGVTDDYASLQAAINAAGAGGKVEGQKGKTYNISNSLTFPNDNVILDLQGAAIRAHTSRSGTLSSQNYLINVSNRDGITIRDGQFLTAADAGAQFIHALSVTRFRLSRCRLIDTHVSAEVLTYALFDSNYVLRGSFFGYGCQDSIWRENQIIDAPLNAIGQTGYNAAPVKRCQFVGNTIKNWGRVGIEVYPSDANSTERSLFLRNNIVGVNTASPDKGGGISAAGNFTRFIQNVITDAYFAAIECKSSGIMVANNTITGPQDNTVTAIMVNGVGTTMRGASVVGNEISGGYKGITAIGGALDVIASGNNIVNPYDTGIDQVAVAQGNRVSFTTPTIAAVVRYGIKINAAVAVANTVTYTTASGPPFAGSFDVGIQYFGLNGTSISNVIDAGTRTDLFNNFGFGAPAGSLTGWRLINNRGIGTVPFTKSTVANASMDLDHPSLVNDANQTALRLFLSTDTQPRFNLYNGGKHEWGAGGATAVDTNLYRSAADKLKTDDMLIAALGLGVGNFAAATTPGSVIRKMEVFDASGASIGFVPIYNAIT